VGRVRKSLSHFVQRNREGTLDLVLGGGLISLVVGAVGMALSFLSHIVLSRVLGSSEYGLYAIILGWVMILVVPAKFGVDHTVLRFASVYVEKRNMDGLRLLKAYVVRFWLMSSASVVIALLVLVVLAPFIIGIAPVDVIWTGLLIAALAGLGIFSSFYRAIRKVFLSQFYVQILHTAILVAILVVALALKIQLTAEDAVMLTSVSALCAFGVLLLGLRRLFVSDGSETTIWPIEEQKRWFGLSWPTFVTAVSQQIMNWGNIIILGWLASTAEAGHYAVAVRLAALATFGLSAVSTVSGPLVASTYAQGAMEELRRIAYTSARLALIFAVILMMLLAALGPLVLSAFGDDFSGAYIPMLVLLVGGLINSFTGSVAHFLTMTDRQHQVLWITVASAIVSICLGCLLISNFGIIGAAVATTVTVFMSNGLMTLRVRKQLGIDATALGLKRSEL
jgi:O-antigen/teichoic acid export membrane protein